MKLTRDELRIIQEVLFKETQDLKAKSQDDFYDREFFKSELEKVAEEYAMRLRGKK